MSFLKTVGKFLLSPIGAVAGLFGSKSKVIQPQAAPLVPTRNDAVARAEAADQLARRTGARRLRRTKVGGAEASTGPKTSLLGRSG